MSLEPTNYKISIVIKFTIFFWKLVQDIPEWCISLFSFSLQIFFVFAIKLQKIPPEIRWLIWYNYPCIILQGIDQPHDQIYQHCISCISEIDIEKVVQDSIRIFCSTPKSATYRQHARPPRRAQEKKDGRPTVSYYSRDYNDLPVNELVIVFFIGIYFVCWAMCVKVIQNGFRLAGLRDLSR